MILLKVRLKQKVEEIMLKNKLSQLSNTKVVYTANNRQYQGQFHQRQLYLFTRKEVFILILMMYSNQIENDNQIMKQSGFYQINMEQIKQSDSQQSYEKLKCIHSQFIQNDESSIIQMQIQDIENQIRAQQQIMFSLQCQFKTKLGCHKKSYISQLLNFIFQFMDALYYQNWLTQFDQSFIQKKLLKGYDAFSLALEHLEIENISTGKWGCGIFHGDLTLKFLIQLLAFSQAYQDMINKNQLGQNQIQRSIIFNSFNDEQFEYLVQEQKAQFSKQNSSIKYIHQLIEDLSKRVNSKKNNYAKN
ncbi:unnamed protein product (macronuclear) [Paramecium tetraurelia]|uniref:PARG catalytic Macro domain-containing protein n=1 Tax=Paramecium tetraurelia TaxID=5888 RepID=A0DVE9_PARTE|nr:uncharacterized protein GSPATT00020680001 [Paramecium tetraurelia]CAK87016.1 unnamed protein product [Paramecium tetraurelia]|eukprot:XP_001454413.1 hypothetical protein (macronuclear) [Paramecium tetraurelia strain d4-2]